MFRIYMVINEDSGKVYIGKTSISLAERWYEHLKKANDSVRKYYFYNAIRKHGKDKFHICQIDCTESEQEANELEKKYIQEFQSHNREFGYNGTLGGDGGFPTEETRLKLIEARKRTPRKPMLGKHHSEETKAKLREARKRQVPSMLGKRNPNAIAAMNAATRGVPRSDETKSKISAAQKGLQAGEKHPMYGKKHTEETKQKMHLAQQAYRATHPTPSGKNSHMYGRHLSAETKAKLSASTKAWRARKKNAAANATF